jgi:hypothetical protein
MPSINDIKQQILTEAQSQASLSGLTSTSKAAIYNIWAYVVAVVIWLLYEFFDEFKIDMSQMIREQKRYSRLWFRGKALEYRHGQDLPAFSDEYDTEVDETTNLPVTRAAVEELELNLRKHLFIKVATGEDELSPVSDLVKTGLEQYFGRIKPAGTKIVIFSDVADELKLNLKFFYNPLVLDATGARIDGSDDEPVQNAIRSFLKDLPFNGELRLTALVDLLQNIEGCADREVYINEASYRYGTLTSFQPISSNYYSNAGYMVVSDENLTINFIPKNVQI